MLSTSEGIMIHVGDIRITLGVFSRSEGYYKYMMIHVGEQTDKSL